MLGEPIRKQIIEEVVNRTITFAKNSGDPLYKSSTHYALGDIATRTTFASITSVPTPGLLSNSIRIESFIQQDGSGPGSPNSLSSDPNNNYSNNYWYGTEATDTQAASGRPGAIPPPGISEVSTRYLGSGALLGTTKETQVTLHIHSNDQYNKLVPIFVRIGKPLLVEFGFTNPQIETIRQQFQSIKEWYIDVRTEEQIKEGVPPTFVLNDDLCSKFPDDLALATRGNIECVFGRVTNYDITLTPYGGYDISLTLLSGGHSFYKQDFSTDVIPRLGPFASIVVRDEAKSSENQSDGEEIAAFIPGDDVAGRALDLRDPLIMLAKYREVIQEDFNIVDTFKAPTEADGNAEAPIVAALESGKNYFFSTECASTYAYPEEQKGNLIWLSRAIGNQGFMVSNDESYRHMVAMHHSRDIMITVTDYAIDGSLIWAESFTKIPWTDIKVTSKLWSSTADFKLCPINYYVTMGYIEDNILSRLFGLANTQTEKIISGIRSIFKRSAGNSEDMLDTNKMLVNEYMVPKNLNEVLVNTPASIALLNDATNGTMEYESGLLENIISAIKKGADNNTSYDIEINEIRAFNRSIAKILSQGFPFHQSEYQANLLNEDSPIDTPSLKVADYRSMYVNLDVVIKAFVGEGNDDFIHRNYFPSAVDYAPKGDKNQFNLWEEIEGGIELEPDHFVETFEQGMSNLLDKISYNFYNFPELNLGTNVFFPDFAQVYDAKYVRTDMPTFAFDSYSRNSLVTNVDLKSTIPSNVQLAATIGASQFSNLPIESYNSHYNSSLRQDLMQNIREGKPLPITSDEINGPSIVHSMQFGGSAYLDKYDAGSSPFLGFKDPKVEKILIENVNEATETPDEKIDNTKQLIQDTKKIQKLNNTIDLGTAGLGGSDNPAALPSLNKQYQNFVNSPEANSDGVVNVESLFEVDVKREGYGGGIDVTTESGENLFLTYPPPIETTREIRTEPPGNTSTPLGGLPNSLTPGGSADTVENGVVTQDTLGQEIGVADEELAVIEGDDPNTNNVGGVDLSKIKIVKDIQLDLKLKPNNKSIFMTGLSTDVIDLNPGRTESKEEVRKRKTQSLRDLIGVLGKHRMKNGGYVQKEDFERKFQTDTSTLIDAIRAYVELNQTVSDSANTLHDFIKNSKFDTLDVKINDHGPLFRNNIEISVGDDWIAYVEFLIHLADRHAMSSLQGQAFYYELSMDMDGLSGILPGQSFTLTYLPDLIAKNFYFVVKNINQSISKDGWKTTIEGLQRRNYSTGGTKNVGDFIADHTEVAVPPAKKKRTNSAQPLPEPERPNIPIPSDDEDILPDLIFEVEPLTDADFLDPIFFNQPLDFDIRRPEDEPFKPDWVVQPGVLRDVANDIRRPEPPDLLADLYDTPRVPSGTPPPPPSPKPFIPYEFLESDTAELMLTIAGGKPDISGLEGGPQKTLVLNKKGRPSSDAHSQGNMKTTFGVTDILSAKEYDKIKETFKTAYNLQDRIIDDFMAELYEERTIIDQVRKINQVDKALERTGNKTIATGNPKYDRGPGYSVLVYLRKDSAISSLIKDIEELQKTYIGNDPSNVSGTDNNYVDDIIVGILSEPDRTLLTTIPMGMPEPEAPLVDEQIADADTYYDEFQQGTDQDQEEPMEADPATIMRGRTLDSYNTPEPEPTLADALDNDTQDAPPAPADEPKVESVIEYKVTKSREQFLSEARAVIGYAGVAVYDPRAYMVAMRDGVEIASADEPKSNTILNDPVKARQELERQGKWNGGVYNLLLQRNPNASADHSDAVDFDYMNRLLKKALTTEQDARVYTQTFLKTIELGNARYGLNNTPDNYRGSGSRPIKVQDYSDIVIYPIMVSDAKKKPANDGTTFKSSQGDITETIRAKYYCHANNQFAQKFKACYQKFPNLRPAV